MGQWGGVGGGLASTKMKKLLNVLGKTHMGGCGLFSNMCLRVKNKSEKEGEIG